MPKHPYHLFKFNTNLVALLVTSFLGALLLSGLVGKLLEGSALNFPISYFVSFAVPLLAVIWRYQSVSGQKIGFNKQVFSLKNWLLILPMMLGAMLASEFFVALIPTEGGFLGQIYSEMEKVLESVMNQQLSAFVTIVVLAPILEEFLLRGLVMRAYLNQGLSPQKAIIYSALWFGLIHANPWQFVGAMLMGLVLGYAYYKCQNIWVPVLFHAFNNGLAFVLSINHNTQQISESYHVSTYLSLMIGILLVFIGWKMSKNIQPQTD